MNAWNRLTLFYTVGRGRSGYEIRTDYLTISRLYSPIFTSPEATNCFSIITLMIIRENKIIGQFQEPIKIKFDGLLSISDSETLKNLTAILKTVSLQCYNHRAVIIAGKSEAPSQSQRSIFDNHQCNYTKT